MSFLKQLEKTKQASKILARIDTKTKNKFLENFALLLKQNIKKIVAANKQDLKNFLRPRTHLKS